MRLVQQEMFLERCATVNRLQCAFPSRQSPRWSKMRRFAGTDGVCQRCEGGQYDELCSAATKACRGKPMALPVQTTRQTTVSCNHVGSQSAGMQGGAHTCSCGYEGRAPTNRSWGRRAACGMRAARVQGAEALLVDMIVTHASTLNCRSSS